MADEFKRLDRELVYKGSIVDFYKDTVKVPNGNVVKWDFIKHQGAAAVVPVMEDGRILMVRQYRNALDRYTLEIPAGGLNGPEEPTMEAAARELEEETGYIYVATDLTPGSQHLDEDEYINVEAMTVDELCDKIFAGEIEDSKTISAIMSYRAKYGSK